MSENVVRGIRRCDTFDERKYDVEFVDGRTETLWSVTTYLEGVPKPVGLIEWFKNEDAEEIRERSSEGMQRGSRVHYAAWVLAGGGLVLFQPPKGRDVAELRQQNEFLMNQCRISGKPFVVIQNQDEMLQVNRIVEWFAALGITAGKVRYREVIGWSLKLRTAGTLDLIAWVEAGDYKVAGSSALVIPESGYYVIDYKTGRVDLLTAKTQVVTYKTLAEESLPEMRGNIRGCMVVSTDATTTRGIPGVNTYLIMPDEYPQFEEAFKSAQYLWHLRNPHIKALTSSFKTPAFLPGEGWSEVPSGFQVNEALAEGLAPDVVKKISSALGDTIKSATESERIRVPASSVRDTRMGEIDKAMRKITPDYPFIDTDAMKFCDTLIGSSFGMEADEVMERAGGMSDADWRAGYTKLTEAVDKISASRKKAKKGKDEA